MKKNYQKPTLKVVNINSRYQLLSGSGTPYATKAAGNANFNETITGGNGDARSRSFSDWDEE